jgi:multicomponent Na+:H+ antiporter subunit D
LSPAGALQPGSAAVQAGQWWWALVVLVGGLLAGGYVFLVLARALAEPLEPLRLLKSVSRGR